MVIARCLTEDSGRTLGRTVPSIYMCSSTFFFGLLFTVNTVHPQISMIQLLAQPQTGGVCRWPGRERERERRRRRTSGVSFKEEATDRHTPAATWWSAMWERPLVALQGPASLPIFGRQWEPDGPTPVDPFTDPNRGPSWRPSSPIVPVGADASAGASQSVYIVATVDLIH